MVGQRLKLLAEEKVKVAAFGGARAVRRAQEKAEAKRQQRLRKEEKADERWQAEMAAAAGARPRRHIPPDEEDEPLGHQHQQPQLALQAGQGDQTVQLWLAGGQEREAWLAELNSAAPTRAAAAAGGTAIRGLGARRYTFSSEEEEEEEAWDQEELATALGLQLNGEEAAQLPRLSAAPSTEGQHTALHLASAAAAASFAALVRESRDEGQQAGDEQIEPTSSKAARRRQQRRRQQEKEARAAAEAREAQARHQAEQERQLKERWRQRRQQEEEQRQQGYLRMLAALEGEGEGEGEGDQQADVREEGQQSGAAGAPAADFNAAPAAHQAEAVAPAAGGKPAGSGARGKRSGGKAGRGGMSGTAGGAQQAAPAAPVLPAIPSPPEAAAPPPAAPSYSAAVPGSSAPAVAAPSTASSTPAPHTAGSGTSSGGGSGSHHGISRDGGGSADEDEVAELLRHLQLEPAPLAGPPASGASSSSRAWSASQPGTPAAMPSQPAIPASSAGIASPPAALPVQHQPAPAGNSTSQIVMGVSSGHSSGGGGGTVPTAVSDPLSCGLDTSQLAELVVCNITQEPMQDPVVAADGMTYERAAISAWFAWQEAARQAPTSPLTGVPLPNCVLQPNRAVRSLADALAAAGLL